MIRAKVSERGQVTIPKVLREREQRPELIPVWHGFYVKPQSSIFNLQFRLAGLGLGLQFINVLLT